MGFAKLVTIRYERNTSRKPRHSFNSFKSLSLPHFIANSRDDSIWAISGLFLRFYSKAKVFFGPSSKNGSVGLYCGDGHQGCECECVKSKEKDVGKMDNGNMNEPFK